MTKERIQYRIDRSESDGLYYVDIKREMDGEWNSMHVVTRATMWGSKFHAKRWIKKWAKGKRQRSYMNIVTVDRKW